MKRIYWLEPIQMRETVFLMLVRIARAWPIYWLIVGINKAALSIAVALGAILIVPFATIVAVGEKIIETVDQMQCAKQLASESEWIASVQKKTPELYRFAVSIAEKKTGGSTKENVEQAMRKLLA